MPQCSPDPITNGNLEARSFIADYGQFARALDNTIDNGTWDSVSVLNVLALANRTYSHPFYRRHWPQLQITVLLVTSLWAISVRWEKEPELWKRTWANVLRHADVQLMAAIALITGSGFDTMEKTSRIFLAVSFADHRLKHAEPS